MGAGTQGGAARSPRASSPRAPGAPTATAGEEPLRLALQVPVLIQNAARALTAVYRTQLHETGLTYPQYLAMLALWENGELTVGELGTLLRLHCSTLSPLLKRLQAAGFVVRERTAADERFVVIRLTAAGQDLREQARGIPAAIRAAAGLSTEDLRTLSATLGRLIDLLDAASGGP